MPFRRMVELHILLTGGLSPKMATSTNLCPPKALLDNLLVFLAFLQLYLEASPVQIKPPQIMSPKPQRESHDSNPSWVLISRVILVTHAIAITNR